MLVKLISIFEDWLLTFIKRVFFLKFLCFFMLLVVYKSWHCFHIPWLALSEFTQNKRKQLLLSPNEPTMDRPTNSSLADISTQLNSTHHFTSQLIWAHHPFRMFQAPLMPFSSLLSLLTLSFCWCFFLFLGITANTTAKYCSSNASLIVPLSTWVSVSAFVGIFIR